MIIAIDGPSASGKGVLARRLARHLGLAHLETGALYRAVALKVARAGGGEEPAAAAARSLQPHELADPELRAEAIGELASRLAALQPVRDALLDFQRGFAAQPPGGAGGAVLDGRDVGTVVCPEADHKIFLTARTEIRAARRAKELRGKGLAVIDSAVLEDMRRRDARDSERAAAPLKAAPDALVLDTSDLDEEQAFRAALAFIEQRIGARRS